MWYRPERSRAGGVGAAGGRRRTLRGGGAKRPAGAPKGGHAAAVRRQGVERGQHAGPETGIRLHCTALCRLSHGCAVLCYAVLMRHVAHLCWRIL